MGYLHRAVPNKTTSAQIEGSYNDNGRMIDPNTGKVLEKGKIDRGHKYGYEEKVMRRCAEKCHMSQKEYTQMMQNGKLFQWEDSSSNRSRQYECKDYSVQLHNCFNVIRQYKAQTRGQSLNTVENEGAHLSRENGRIHTASGSKDAGSRGGGRDAGNTAPMGQSAAAGPSGGSHDGTSGGHAGSGAGHGGHGR